MMRVVVEVPATTANLGPGFDCLGMALDLWNRFEVSVEGDTLEIHCEGEGADDIPRNDRNLMFRALRLGLMGEPRMPGLRLKSICSVPVSSGLGSSATAIVGGLVAANALRSRPLTTDEVLNLAAILEGHPDNVASAILGGLVATAVAETGYVEAIALPVPPELCVIIAVPRLKVSTAESRATLPSSVAFGSAVYSLSRAALWVAAIAKGQLEALRTATRDALHQDSRSAHIPGLRAVLDNAVSAGAFGAALSGSGPSVAAFCQKHQSSHVAEAMISGFESAGVEARVLVTKPAGVGARVLN